jgi:mannosyltransferase OCH1-like enzyme
MDMDVECLQPVDPTLAGFEAVLQMEDENPKSLNNAVMASAPGHPLWLTMAHLLEERCASTPPLHPLWFTMAHLLQESCGVAPPRM